MTLKQLLTLSSFVLGATIASGATQNATSYSYNTNPNASYPDSPFGQLTDGVGDLPKTWGGGNSITASDIGPFVGWLNSDPSIRFDFADGQVHFDSVTAWLSDSDSAAGVYIPLTMTVATDEGFNETYNIANPAGSGNMVPVIFSGLDVKSDHLTVSFGRGGSWTMLTEVEFDAVPEPGAYALLVGFATFGFIVWKRRRHG